MIHGHSAAMPVPKPVPRRMPVISYRSVFLGMLMVAVLTVGADVLRLNPAMKVALPYRYSLAAWEASNLLSKWTHRVASALPWNSRPAADRKANVHEYFRLATRISALNGEIERSSALRQDSKTAELEAELAQAVSARRALRDDVEEVIEATLSAVVADEGISTWGGLTFPPVDIRLAQPPKALIASPRDRIAQLHSVLVGPAVSVTQSEAMEDALADEWDLSGLVTPIGGLATYPASIDNGLPLKWTLGTAAHEWLHHYLTLLPPGRPFGRLIFSSPEMRTLNETVAEIAGREIGGRAYEMLGGADRQEPAPAPGDPAGPSEADGPQLDYAQEMRRTRERVDELLAEGAVEEAEAYMEERRRFFVENGFYIRKLNQAYFAYYGTYAVLPESSSPIGGQLLELRDLLPDLKTFLTTMSEVSSYDHFLEIVARVKAEARR